MRWNPEQIELQNFNNKTFEMRIHSLEMGKSLEVLAPETK